MANIIELMKELGYPVDNKGVCWGLAYWACRAFSQDSEGLDDLLGDYATFANRMKFIDNFRAADIPLLANQIKAAYERRLTIEGNQETRPLAGDEQMLISLPPFFFGVSILQEPNSFLEVFGLDDARKWYSQFDLLSKVTDLLRYEHSARSPSYQETHVKTIFLLSRGPSVLRQLLTKMQKVPGRSVGLVFNSHNHTTFLCYARGTWYFTDHSRLRQYDTIETLLPDLIQSSTYCLNDSENIALLMDVYIRPATRREDSFESWFASLFQNQDQSGWVVDPTEDVDARVLSEGIRYCGDALGIGLRVAAAFGYPSIIKTLLRMPGTHVNYVMGEGATALFMAAQNGYLSVVKALLQVPGIEVNQALKENGATALYVAAQNGHLSVVMALLQACEIKVNQALTNGATPLFMAAHNGHLPVVMALLQACEIKVNQARTDNGATPLFAAVYKGHAEVVKRLLKSATQSINTGMKADIETLLVEAKKRGRQEQVCALTGEKGKILNFTPLHAAAFFDFVEIIQTLLESGAECNALTESGLSALDLACAMGHARARDVLLRHELNKFIQAKVPLISGSEESSALTLLSMKGVDSLLSLEEFHPVLETLKIQVKCHFDRAAQYFGDFYWTQLPYATQIHVAGIIGKHVLSLKNSTPLSSQCLFRLVTTSAQVGLEDRLVQGINFLNDEWVTKINAKILTPIESEEKRLEGDLGNHFLEPGTRKASIFKEAHEKIHKELADTFQQCLSTPGDNRIEKSLESMQNALINELKELIQSPVLSEKRNSTAAFFKGLLGVALGLCCLAVPFCFSRYRAAFFWSSSKRHVKEMEVLSQCKREELSSAA